MPTILTTPFVKIAQSGPCADGRTIDPQWLRDMAETYDPDIYRAKIWPEHIRYGNNYGTVLELAADEAEGVVSLLARMVVNAQYVLANQYDQKLSFSIEVGENFANSGKAYLVGLGITDSPASLGTDELRFSRRIARGGQDGARVFAGAPIDSASLSQDGTTEPAAPGWFTRFLKNFSPSEDKSMDEKQIKDFSTRLDGLEAGLRDIKTLVEGKFADQATPAFGPETDQAAAQNDASGAASDKQAAAMREGFAAAMAPMLERLDAIEKRFAAVKPGAPIPDTAGPADDESPIL